MALLSGAAPGTDIVFSQDRLESARNFANKIWNAARFIFLNMERSCVEPWTPEGPKTYQIQGDAIEDRWIWSRFNACAEQVNRSISQYRYHEAAQSVWQFVWSEFCDWYIELKKLKFEDNSGRNADWSNLLAVFEGALRLLHPVMPFLTEELWQRLTVNTPGRPESISLAAFPEFRSELADPAAEQAIGIVQNVITFARNMRAELKIDPKIPLKGSVYARGDVLALARAQGDAISKIANVTLDFVEGAAPADAPAVRSTPDFDLALDLPAEQLQALRERHKKELEQAEKNIDNLERQFADTASLSRKPEHIVQNMRQKLEEYKIQRDKLRKAL
jgi:valyl-tRNA synthetase